MKKINFLLFMLVCSLLVQAKVYDLVELGADNLGKSKCTEIINKAILNAANEGGGTIFFPSGKYLTGPIHLKSNITIDIEAGAFVQFSDDFDDYLPYVRARYEGIFMKTFSSFDLCRRGK